MSWRSLFLASLLLVPFPIPSALAGAASPASPNDPVETAHAQFLVGKYSEAIQTLQAALQRTPQDARLHFWLCRAYYELRDFDQAIASGNRAVQQDPKNSDYHFWLGKAYGKKADRESSLSTARKTKREFEEAVRLNPLNIPARRALMEYLAQAPSLFAGGSKEKARQQIEAIAGLDPIQGHLAQGDYWMDGGKPERAEEEYRKALELKPTDAEPYLEIADFYLEQRDAGNMERVVEAAAQIAPSEPRLDYYRGAARVMAGGRPAEAELYLKTYLKNVPPRSEYPSHASAHEWLGKLYEQTGKRAEALTQYRLALELDPKLKDARHGLQRLGR
jgi:tetratricopeptide (TPR) repeat protein